MFETVGEAIAEAEALFAELTAKGTKFIKEATKCIKRTPNGNITWLEIGNETAGLMHIMIRHAEEFAKWGFKSKEAVSEILMKTISSSAGKEVEAGVRVYEVVISGETKQLQVVTGSNGFIVTAHPVKLNL